MAAFPGSAPILVDSAGCGAALKDYGHLVGTDEAQAFAARVLDIHEWLAAHGRPSPGPSARRAAAAIAVQDPCHLRHVQRREASVRTVLEPYGDLVELDDEGRCCGAGGAFSALQPGAGRPHPDPEGGRHRRDGCPTWWPAPTLAARLWLAAAGVPVRHPMEIVADAGGAAGWPWR